MITPIPPFLAVLADDHVQARAALRLLLENKLGMCVIEVSKVKELFALLLEVHPDILILDQEMPGVNPKEIFKRLRSVQPGLVIVAASSQPDMEQVVLSAGADVFLCKSDPLERVVMNIHTAIELARQQRE